MCQRDRGCSFNRGVGSVFHHIYCIKLPPSSVLIMSSTTASSEQASTPQSVSKKNGRPLSAESKMKTKPGKSPKAGKGGLRGIFKNKKAKENGVVPVKPSCFDDDFVRRPESPDTPSRPVTSNKVKGKDESRGYGLWRSKVGLLIIMFTVKHCMELSAARLHSRAPRQLSDCILAGLHVLSSCTYMCR